MKRTVLIAAGALLIAAAAGVSIHWRGQARVAAIAAENIPPAPDLDGQSARLAERIRSADEAVRKGTGGIEATRELSRLYHANGFYHEAWTVYSGLLMLEPKNAIWPYRLASILAGYGQLEEALPLYVKSLELDPDYLPARIRIGDTLLKLNRIDEAKEAYDALLARDSDNAYARVGRARVAIARDDWETARVELEAAIAATRFQIGADLLVDVYEKLGHSAKERVVLQNAKWGSFADIPDPRMLSLMDDCYDSYQISIASGWAVHQGDLETGLKYIEKAVSLDPENANLRFQIAGLHLHMGNIEAAVKHYERCVELQPDFADAWLRLIDHARENGNENAARRLLDTALRKCPESPSMHNEKGDQLMAAGQYEQAMYYFKRSIELRPNEASGYIRLARLLLKTGREAEGIEQLQLALKCEPNNEFVVTTLAFQAIQVGDKEEADEWFRRLADMPRLTASGFGDLKQQYQRRFGHPPKL